MAEGRTAARPTISVRANPFVRNGYMKYFILSLVLSLFAIAADAPSPDQPPLPA